MNEKSSGYKWYGIGDINAFFGLMFDNMTVLLFMSTILIFVFQYPAEIIYTRMIPGTALGVLIGDLVYTWMAFRLAKKTGNRNVTAMPLGLDTPSTIGIAFAVLGPVYVQTKDPILTWQVGMATLVLIGIVKVVLSFFGEYVQKIVPQAGLLGSLAGIGLCLIGFLPLLKIFTKPVCGLIALGLIFYALVARIKLPRNAPGVLVSILAGTAIYYILVKSGWGGLDAYRAPELILRPGFPTPTLDFLKGMGMAWNYLPIAIPFALLTVVGGINVTESARVAGDNFKTRNILLTEAFATLIAGFCGGVAQSTPYIGQPAYKAMGGRAAYTLATGLFVGLGGMLGYLSLILEILPEAVVAPILIFVGLDIMEQAFLACPKRHAMAVGFSFFPTVARLVWIQMAGLVAIIGFGKLSADNQVGFQVITALGNGFILTAMLWGGAVALMIDRRLKACSGYMAICALLSFFGIIHSTDPDGKMYLPWNLLAPGMNPAINPHLPYQYAVAYLALAAVLFALSFTRETKEPYPEEEVEEALVAHHGDSA